MTVSDEELNRFKTAINLIAVAEKYGYKVVEKGRNTAMKNPAGDSKLIISVKPGGHWTFWDAKDSTFKGTVLQFVARMEGLDVRRNFPRICQKCGEYLASPPVSDYAKPEPIIKREPSVLSREWRDDMQPYGGGYLEGRALSPETIEKFARKIRIDSRGNSCFRHEDLKGNVTGWEKKNKGFTGFTAAGSKALFICRVDEAVITDIIVCESAIDAMSYYERTKQPGLYVSFAGAMSPEQEEMLADLFHRYPAAKVHAATDNDLPTKNHPKGEGEHYYEVIRERCPPAATVIRVCPPEPYKDWNDVLMDRPRQPEPEKDERSYTELVASTSGRGKPTPGGRAR